MESHSTWSSVTGFFQLAECPQGSSMLQCLTEFPSFLRQNNIPSRAGTALWLCIHQSVGIWVVSTFWPLWILPLTAHEQVSVRTRFQFSWARPSDLDCWAYGDPVADHCGAPHQQRTGVPVPPLPHQHLLSPDLLILAMRAVVSWCLIGPNSRSCFFTREPGLRGNAAC